MSGTQTVKAYLFESLDYPAAVWRRISEYVIGVKWFWLTDAKQFVYLSRDDQIL